MLRYDVYFEDLPWLKKTIGFFFQHWPTAGVRENPPNAELKYEKQQPLRQEVRKRLQHRASSSRSPLGGGKSLGCSAVANHMPGLQSTR